MSRTMFVGFVNQMMVKVLVPRYRLSRNPLQQGSANFLLDGTENKHFWLRVPTGPGKIKGIYKITTKKNLHKPSIRIHVL